MSGRSVSFIIFGGILWSCCLAVVLALQRPAPRYSQQFMPETSFTCRNKIVGSYYADPETDCQLFHVCVSVAGVVQDYKFLCPNDTAFDQESQTCADWYDVDCEAATLYYASDNFDLYRLGSGLESLHYDSVRTDAEPQDHLQRSESNDPVRSAANSLNRVNPTTNYNNNNNNNNKDILRGSSSSNFYNSRNNVKDEDYDSDKTYRDEPIVEPKRKPGVRKIARKQQFNNNNNNLNSPSTTLAPTTTTASYNYNNNNNYNRNYYNQRTTYEAPTTTTTTTARPEYNNNYNNRNTQKYTPSTFRPPTTVQHTTYQAPSTTARTTAFNNNYNNNYNNYNNNNYNNNQRVTTPAPTTYSDNYSQDNYNTNTNYNNNNNYKNYNNDYNQYKTRSSTAAPTTTYQTDFTGFQRNYNNIQRSSTAYPTTTTTASTYYDAYSASNQFTGKTNGATAKQSQQTTKFYPNYSTFAPTTYAPPTSKPIKNDNGQYFQQKSSTFFDVTKAPKKNTYNNFESSGKYFEASTTNYDFGRSPAGIGFSPSSINLLAESPKTTTPVPRRNGSPTTYNPNNYNNNNNQRSQPTTLRPTTYSVSSARPFSTTAKFNDVTTQKSTKSSAKKNDYDYAYYDNAGGLEYDGLDLEHVAGGVKESSKITRN